MIGRQISYGFISEVRLEFLEVQHLVFPKFLILRVCGKSFLNECIEYDDRLGCAVLANFLEPSLRFLLVYA